MGTREPETQVHTIHSTGRGSDLYGDCEHCGKHVSETFVLESHGVYVRADGLRYLGATTPGLFGHESCLLGMREHVVRKHDLPRVGKLRAAPHDNSSAEAIDGQSP